MQQGGNRKTEKLLMERSVPGRVGVVMPDLDVPVQPCQAALFCEMICPCLRYRSRKWSNTSPGSAS